MAGLSDFQVNQVLRLLAAAPCSVATLSRLTGADERDLRATVRRGVESGVLRHLTTQFARDARIATEPFLEFDRNAELTVLHATFFPVIQFYRGEEFLGMGRPGNGRSFLRKYMGPVPAAPRLATTHHVYLTAEAANHLQPQHGASCPAALVVLAKSILPCLHRQGAHIIPCPSLLPANAIRVATADGEGVHTAYPGPAFRDLLRLVRHDGVRLHVHFAEGHRPYVLEAVDRYGVSRSAIDAEIARQREILGDLAGPGRADSSHP